MNRRNFLTGSVALPFAPSLKAELPICKLSREFLVDGEVSVQMMVQAHASGDSAEAWRASWHDRAFESIGEWYLQTTEDRDLPKQLQDLPGSMQYHTYVWGAAAADGSMLVGAFRHDHVACVIRIKGDHESVMIRLAEFFAEQRIPDVWELLWSNAQMQAFLPTTESLGMQVEFDEGFWP